MSSIEEPTLCHPELVEGLSKACSIYHTNKYPSMNLLQSQNQSKID